MQVQFTLTLDDPVVEGVRMDQLVFRWIAECDPMELLDISHRWVTSSNFLTSRMRGLTKVGESSLTIEPLEEIPE